MKFWAIIILYIAFFFIPHKFYVVWAHICRGASLLYLIVQAYFLLNGAYTWNDAVLGANDKAAKQKDQTMVQIMLIIFVLVFGAGCFAWIGAQFYWAGTCGLSIAIVAITLLFMLFFYGSAIAQMCCFNRYPFRRNANIFTVTIACIYIVYLTWSAMASNYDDSCQMNMNDSTNTVL